MNETKEKPLLSEPENNLADAVWGLGVVILVIQALILLVAIYGMTNDTLPPGAIDAAMAARSLRKANMAWYAVIDLAAVVPTLALMVAARILHAVNRTAHYLSQRLKR